jgi:hypothetical protein
MRLFEILLLADLLFAAAGMFVFKAAKKILIFPSLSVALSLINMAAEGFRFAMLPAYVLAALLLVFRR